MNLLKTILNQISEPAAEAVPQGSALPDSAASQAVEQVAATSTASQVAAAASQSAEVVGQTAEQAAGAAEGAAQTVNQVAEQATSVAGVVSQAASEATAQVAEQVAAQPGMFSFIEQSDMVGKSLFAILCIMSLITWYLIFVKSISNKIQSTRSKRFLKRFWNANSLEEVSNQLNTYGYNNPFGRLAYHAIKASNYHQQYGSSRLSDVGTGADFTIRNMRRVIDEETARMENGLTIMSSIGATSPFVGLFGTVWGVYHALINIGMSDGVNISEVAGPVGEALIMTGLGLAVAIPAVLALNAFVRRNRVMLSKIDGFAHDVFAFVSTGTTIQVADAALFRQKGTDTKASLTEPVKLAGGANPYPQSEKEEYVMSSFGGFSSNRQQMGTVSEINMIPLIDVMLVLLIIFMITTPLMTHSIKIDVPRVTSQPAEQDPESIDLAIKATGEMFWNNEEVTMDSLREKMRQLVVTQEEKPVNLRIRADGEAYYEQIAQVMAAARGTGVRRLGFITTPDISRADSTAEEAANAAREAAAAEATAEGSATATNAESANTPVNADAAAQNTNAVVPGAATSAATETTGTSPVPAAVN